MVQGLLHGIIGSLLQTNSVTLIGSIVAGMSGYGAGILIGVVLMPMVGVKKIVPIVTILTFYINFWRIILYWEHINWKKSLYFSAEESEEQVAIRARRLEIKTENLFS